MSLNLLNNNSHKPWLNPRVNNLIVDGNLIVSGGSSHNIVVQHIVNMASAHTIFNLLITEIQKSLAFPDNKIYKIVTVGSTHIIKTEPSGTNEPFSSAINYPTLANGQYQKILIHTEEDTTHDLDPLFMTITPSGFVLLDLPTTSPANGFTLLPVTYISKTTT